MKNLQHVPLAAAPLFTQPPPLPPVLQTPTLANMMSYFSDHSDFKWLLLQLQALPEDKEKPSLILIAACTISNGSFAVKEVVHLTLTGAFRGRITSLGMGIDDF